MANRELIIGGSASGKSEYAESCLIAKKNLIYIATMKPFGKDAAEKILRHQNLFLL